MEPKIHIVTDSTAYLPADYLMANPHVHVVPLTVDCDGEIFEDYLENNERFLRAMNELGKKDAVPKTSQPAPGRFAELFDTLVKKGCEVVAVIMSSKFSGTVQSAITAASMVGEEHISVIDSLTSVGALRMLVEDAASAALEGRSREEIVSMVEESKQRMEVLMLTSSLEHLRRGGRIGGAQALVGSLLNIRPVIYISDEGSLEVLEKVRTQKKALSRMAEEIPSNCKRIYCGHVTGEETVTSLQELIAQKLDRRDTGIDLWEVGPVIITHIGTGVVGVFYEVPREQ